MVAVRFTRGETNFLRVDLGASRSGSLPATGATSEPVIRGPTVANTGYSCHKWNRLIQTSSDMRFRFRPGKFYPSPSCRSSYPLKFMQIYPKYIHLAINQHCDS